MLTYAERAEERAAVEQENELDKWTLEDFRVASTLVLVNQVL
jgi:hypothetical protein